VIFVVYKSDVYENVVHWTPCVVIRTHARVVCMRLL